MQFKNPFIFTSFVVEGSFIERGTEPNAAWCNTYSTFSTAFMQVLLSLISPSINLKFLFSKKGIIDFLYGIVTASPFKEEFVRINSGKRSALSIGKFLKKAGIFSRLKKFVKYFFIAF